MTFLFVQADRDLTTGLSRPLPVTSSESVEGVVSR